jgi:putative transcriptional regulator
VDAGRSGRRRRQRYSADREWDAPSVRALRRHLGLTQEELSERLGMRQQTVSEWEIGKHRPRGASRRLLSVIAETAGFAYEAPAGGVTGKGVVDGSR